MMPDVSVDAHLEAGQAALEAGRWADARAAFESTLAALPPSPAGGHPRAVALAGLGEASWWLGDLRRSITCREQAYAEFRRTSDQVGAATVAMGLSITYRSDVGNPAAARGWIGRAERVAQRADEGPLQGWLWMTRAYVIRDRDLAGAQVLQEKALRFAQDTGDVDLELVTVADLGVTLVAKGDVDEGLALVDEAMAGALGGERSQLITVVYAGCDMLVACDLAGDLDRASQWCQVVDRFVADYGCPFLYVECRTLYGGLLLAKGQWERAEGELTAALAMSADVAPALHQLALLRLADLRLRQGRLEEAEAHLRSVGEHPASLLLVGAARLARGEPAGQAALLERRARALTTPCLDLAPVLAMLVDVHLAQGEVEEGTAAAGRLADVAATLRHRHPAALAARAAGRVAAARRDRSGAAAEFERALGHFVALDLPFETAGVRLELAEALADAQPGLAAAEAGSALAEFDRLGAAGHADAAAALLRLLGVVRRARSRSPDGALTRREQEVLHLVGLGLSNPEIAQRLFISRKTAGHHVSNLLAKLGLRNRAEVVAYAARQSREQPDRQPDNEVGSAQT
jgi:DNA-binding CsgD family transcriptional regulator